jgi:hypothetical protein
MLPPIEPPPSPVIPFGFNPALISRALAETGRTVMEQEERVKLSVII